MAKIGSVKQATTRIFKTNTPRDFPVNDKILNVNNDEVAREKNNSRQIKLPSSEVISVKTLLIKNAEIKEKIIVSDFNIRNQNALTKESLKDIYDEIANGYQKDPCFGYMTNGKISLIDGSRRMKCALLSGQDIYVEVSNKEISDSDAQYLVAQSETGKDFSYLEWGIEYKKRLLEENTNEIITIKDFSIKNSLNYEIVIRTLNACRIPDEFWEFLDPYNMSNTLMRELTSLVSKNIDKQFEKMNWDNRFDNKFKLSCDLPKLINDIRNQIKEKELENIQGRDNEIFKVISLCLKKACNTTSKKNKKEKQLWISSVDKSKYISLKTQKDKDIIILSNLDDDKKQAIYDMLININN